VLNIDIEKAVKKIRDDNFKKGKQLSLGDIIDELERIANKEQTVQFDFEYARPTQLDSWRGDYAELAIGFEVDGKIKVKDFLSELKSGVDKYFEGYKGGTFCMGLDTPVWVSNYGHAGNTGIVQVQDLGWCVMLHTQYCEY